MIARVNEFGHTRDFLRFVADALQVSDGLDHRHHHAQVTGRRLALGNDVCAVVVDANFQRVHAMIIGDDLISQRHITIGERFHRPIDLLFHQAAHLQDARTHAFEFGIKFFRNVFAGHFFLSFGG